MLQRLGLAQAIIHKPRLLILDEPTDGVDPVGRREIRDLLYELKAHGVTIFLNSHLLAEVEQFCEEVAIIHKGKVALQGAVKDLTIGKGYRLKVSDVPERLRAELAANASLVSGVNGTVEFLFASRELVNQSIDKLRAERCEIEAVIPSASTLEDIFIQTVRPS
jgi:ABC-2 type transport system ATP-binding protein